MSTASAHHAVARARKQIGRFMVIRHIKNQSNTVRPLNSLCGNGDMDSLTPPHVSSM